MATLPIQGASNRHYDYASADVKNIRTSLLFQAPANFLFVRWLEPTAFEILYAGEAPSLYGMLIQSPNLWDIAQQQYGATALYARPNGNEKNRKREKADLVEKYAPKMNVEYPG